MVYEIKDVASVRTVISLPMPVILSVTVSFPLSPHSITTQSSFLSSLSSLFSFLLSHILPTVTLPPLLYYINLKSLHLYRIPTVSPPSISFHYISPAKLHTSQHHPKFKITYRQEIPHKMTSSPGQRL